MSRHSVSLKYAAAWCCSFFFFFNDTATTEIYTLSLHDALPICRGSHADISRFGGRRVVHSRAAIAVAADRKSTRLNSSHSQISYAVFCLKKKNKHLDQCVRCVLKPAQLFREPVLRTGVEEPVRL